ncbi:hypothetical protein [Alkalibacillus almallahensis]|uniref:hypothetical protein n=1 Tax=Alkalibacillus almallahensis TaxID=1379154 RepID=UPI0014235E30|nr:hypothetical protein [Alkalibacillus almallahensis]NIK11177.1 hypothetical protein [Alkalibacillus almallahensis]
MNKYLNTLITDPSFVGSLIGSLITGTVAVIILGIQIRDKNKTIRSEENKKFVIAVELIKTHIHYTLLQIDDILKTDGNNVSSLVLTLDKHLIDTNKLVHEVDITTIKDSVFKEFQMVRECIKSLNDLTHELISDQSNDIILDESDLDYISNIYQKLESANKILINEAEKSKEKIK